MTGISKKAENVYWLADKQKSPLAFSFSQVVTTIALPNQQPDPFVSVVVMEFKHYPAIQDGLVAKTVAGGFSLTPQNLEKAKGNTIIQDSERYGSVPAHVSVSKKSTYQWRIFVDQPCSMNADVSYNFQGKSKNGTIIIRCAGKSVQSELKPTGQTVGEPRSDWQINSFKSHRIGTLLFPSPGFYDVEMEIVPGKNEDVGFQWLWLGRLK
ncbi:hypothetical protein [Maribellus luteus]|uniref:hypothetical protein n=1 Tax=Maribellus luteus TaxID=2305463 RepID=UPI0011C4AA45|nr:hypothetical protein [Maribellus luteus]